MTLKLFSLYFAFLITAPAALAAEWRTGDRVYIGPAEVIEADLYIAANDVEIAGTVRGDVFVAANTLRFTGNLDGGLTAVVASAELSGQVSSGARVFASSLSLSGVVGRDLIVSGNTLRITEGAQVGGDLIAAVNRADVFGAIVANAKLTVDRLTIGSLASIGGSLEYLSQHDANVLYGAKISQNLGRVAPPESTWGSHLWGVLLFFLGVLGLGLFWLWLFPTTSQRAVDTLSGSVAKSMGAGLLAFFGVPLLAALLFVPGVFLGLLPVSVVLFSLFVVGVVSAGSLVGLWLGEWLLERLHRPSSRVGALALGAALIALAVNIPWLGGLFGFFILISGLGAPLLLAYRARMTKAI